MKNYKKLLALFKGVLALHLVFFSNFATAQPGNGNGMPGGPGANFWNLQGNQLNTGEFLGSTNNASLIFKTNNLERISLLGNGEILFHNFVGNNNGLVGYNPNGTLYNIPFTGNGTMVLSDNGSFISNAAISGWSMNGNFLYNATHQVGIGVTAPSTSHILTVNGDALFTGEITTTGIKVLQKIEADTIKGAIRVDVNGNLMLGEEGGYDGITSRYEDLKINSRPGYDFNVIFSANNTGNVGIGTTSPSKKFEVNGTSGFLGPVSVSSSLFVQDSASFSQKVKMNGEVMMPNLDTIPDINNSYLLLTDSSGNVYTRKTDAGFFDPSLPDEKYTCDLFSGGPINNPEWAQGTNKLFVCNPVRVGVGTDAPLANLHVRSGDLWVDQGKFFIRNDASATGNPIEIRKGSDKIFMVNKDGIMYSTEVRVRLSQDFPDYVFKKDYSLMPLNELKTYINQKGHLPGIAPAKEMEEKGEVNLGEMNLKMLEKIEELTLYMIELKEENEEIKKELEELKNKHNLKK